MQSWNYRVSLSVAINRGCCLQLFSFHVFKRKVHIFIFLKFYTLFNHGYNLYRGSVALFNLICYHTRKEVKRQTSILLSLYTVTRQTNLSTVSHNAKAPGRTAAKIKNSKSSVWLGRGSTPQPPTPETDALITRPPRWSVHIYIYTVQDEVDWKT